MKPAKALRSAVNALLRPAGLQVVRTRDITDYYLHSYDSYEQYRDVQVFHNKRKLANVWADETTLGVVADTLEAHFGRADLRGLCHGARNGFEQGFFRTRGFEATGTDISDTATQFAHSVQWDFHDPNPEWTGAFDFVYSNSLDQGWNPRAALVAWLNQLRPDGLLVIEHTEAHGPSGASEMDPFGVRPTVMPYVLAEWFGFDISLRFVRTRKANNGLDAWLFFVRRNVAEVA
jgi:SAM-dependent methyltransferase